MTRQVTDHYAVLGVPRDATRAAIRSAYRALSRDLHPDRTPDAAAPPDSRAAGNRNVDRASALQAVQDAYQVLSTDRAAYDAELREAEQPAPHPRVSTAKVAATKRSSAQAKGSPDPAGSPPPARCVQWWFDEPRSAPAGRRGSLVRLDALPSSRPHRGRNVAVHVQLTRDEWWAGFTVPLPAVGAPPHTRGGTSDAVPVLSFGPRCTPGRYLCPRLGERGRGSAPPGDLVVTVTLSGGT